MRKWLGRLLLVLLGLVAGVFLAEGAARVLDSDGAADILFNAPDNAPNGLYTAHRTFGWYPTPGFDGVQSSLGYRVRLRVNQAGLRGPEVGPHQGKRWLVGGDSFTFAAQVDEDETFAQLLGEATGAEVLNAGADGYGTAQTRLRYLAIDQDHGVDGLIVVFFLGNDLQDNQRWPQTQRESRTRTEGMALGAPEVPFPWSFLSRNSYLYGRWRMSIRKDWMGEPGNHEADRWKRELVIFTRKGGGELSRLVQTTRNDLQQLLGAVTSRGDALLVAIAPPAFVIDAERRAATFDLVGLDPQQADPDAPSRELLRELSHLNVAGCNLSEPLRKAHADGEKLYFDYDGHWTRAGHRVVADTLTRCVQARGW